MIPKIIHYCWFGRGLMPKSQRDCIKGWKRLMPDWTFMRWDESNFDVNVCSYASRAYRNKQYAFVADVARLHALLEFGGIYIDTDVQLFQSLEAFIDCQFFSGIEHYYEFESEHIAERYLAPSGEPLRTGQDVPHMEILTSTMGSVPKHPLVQSLIDYYHSIDATQMATCRDVIFDRLVARQLVPYGFRYVDETQQLADNMIIYGTGTFGYAFSPNPTYTVSYHHNATSWDYQESRALRMRVWLDKLGILCTYDAVRKLLKHRHQTNL